MCGEGKWADTSEEITEKIFHDTIRQCFKLEVVSKVLAGNTIRSVVVEVGITPGQLYLWGNKYKIHVNMAKMPGSFLKKHPIKSTEEKH